ncbi:hypothetical protein, partial [Streptomyces galilaeus]|uniref:hypothetical protein n=1 Tax=Streptomyces galilaeus TaxID=33899 RepID=UPI0038F66544
GFRPLTQAEVAAFDRPVKKTDDPQSKARRILEQASPPGMAAAARDLTDRWLQTLWPLEPVLVRAPAPAPAKRPGRSGRPKR